MAQRTTGRRLADAAAAAPPAGAAPPAEGAGDSWNRAHFGAWCIISAPLILGLDVRDDKLLAPILPVITNAEAIAVNQQWSGHPGRLLQTWPNTGPNSSAPSGFAWGEPCSDVDATQHGWTFDAATGHLTAHSGACLAHSTAAYGDTALVALPCAATDAGQQWKRDGTSFRDAATGKKCLDLFGGQQCASAPRANLFACNSGKNQQWNTTADGQLVDACGACIGTKPTPPPGASDASGGEVQLWAKPQPAGTVAALVINNSPTAFIAKIEVAALGMSGTQSVRDIWARRDIGSTTDLSYSATIPPYDSAFLLFAPQNHTEASLSNE